ncbi:hypothetical protein I302_107932 [Kwoniella bestiolae CBS 10118]|uniref:Uncharacterized protein n=1 Tax=Kwoniella bestiolae CBS 10118 TaxID=1296100 RepID=A0A1B9FX64_9TREE|nr:hypothetical protein I302_07705 [Kwoniella bestiolae CBS 10118]OCF23351.1 hypothetical protein I302_07705 [Kwoniella bestiolae CBS 10118]
MSAGPSKIDHVMQLPSDPTAAPRQDAPTINAQPASGLAWPEGLLSVPVDCDPTLWASFVDSTLWNSRPPDDEGEQPLLRHFTQFASVSVVVRHGQNSASKFYQDLAMRATQDNQKALMHAVLAVSAQHLSNLARKVADQDSAARYATESSKQRSLALHLLRVAAAGAKSQENALTVAGDTLEMGFAVLVMLTLAALLKGDADIVPVYLGRASAILDRIKPAESPGLLPTSLAIHSIYKGFHHVSRSKQVQASSLFPKLDDRPVWSDRADNTVETIVGIRRDMFMLFLRIHSLVLEADIIHRAQERSSDDEDDELEMMRMEIQAECSAVETELRDRETWTVKWLANYDDRLRLGHEFYRLTIRMMILTEVFQLKAGHTRVQQCVQEALPLTKQVQTGLEIGLNFPYVIIAGFAEADTRSEFTAFVKRCQWKGSASPRIAEQVVETVWSRRDEGKMERWRDVLTELGCPLMV